MVKRVFIIHGWEGTSNSNWFPWLKAKLEEREIEVSVPQLPDPYNPKLGLWLDALRKTVGEPDKETYLIGHSLGCITILRYLGSLKNHQEVGGVVLVAGFTDDLGYAELSNFYTEPIDWHRINLRCNKFVVIASDNDPYVALRYSNTLRDKLNARVIIEHNMGHFNMAELHVALNELLKMILKKSNNP